ncbi:transporter substrate-binding domain-containing protein [Vibrio profundum]|uniref:substrate-binding periplasmic protein n=1 Tax=Vibrio profundum TaxID=2910247 RepID=UPI003D1293F7
MKSVIVAVLLALLIPLSAYAEKKKLRICYENVEYPPFTFGSDDVPNRPGYMVDMLKLAANASGAEAVLHRLPWKRCIRSIKRGEMDGMFGAIWAKEREAWSVYPKNDDQSANTSLHLIKIIYPIYVKKGSKLRWDGKVLSGVKNGVAAPPGYVAQKTLMGMGVYPDKKIHITDMERGIRMVSLNRIDGYVVNQTSGDQVVADLGLQSEIETLPKPFTHDFLYLAFSQHFFYSNRKCAKAIWHKLAEVRDTYSETFLENYKKGQHSAFKAPSSLYENDC